LKINNSLDVARWEKLNCSCVNTSVMTEYPIHKCERCKCKEAWESVPQENFKVNDPIIDKKGVIIETKTRTIQEITLVRGHDLQDVIGWSY